MTAPVTSALRRRSEKLSAAEARRIALTAQGFARPRPSGRIDIRHARKLFDHVGVIQVDSVNVLVRSQELPLFARLGPHPRGLLPQMLDRRELFEYWGHEASLLPVDHHRLFRWRMEAAADGDTWGGLRHLGRDQLAYARSVLDEVRDGGPLTAGELSDPGAKGGPWWGWNKGKRALEYLFWAGLVTARRRTNFEREYDIPERLLPEACLRAPTPSADDAQRELLTIAAAALGVATAKDLADYHRLKLASARPLLGSLVEQGRLLPVDVEGWSDRAYLHPSATAPRRVHARAVLSPFDSLVWDRPRTERLWDFRYRIEIYTPAPKRQYGYYVLPFLFGDELVGRVDLKADRAAGVLRVHAAWIEPGRGDHAVVARALADELAEMAAWLELDAVRVGERGDLSKALAANIR